ncbi:hypothetical protein [Lysinibacillus sp. 54212]|uniref:hypothetical protein n=1 Tax=Lysinibacillus sp. 54212 TaxID=3119829 RepID=UPI002FC6C5CD
MAEGKYTMVVNSSKKSVDMMVSGSFTPEQANKFIADYNSKLSGIKADEFVLNFDCRDLNLVTQDMIPSLEACFQLYSKTGFNKVVIGIPKNSPILKMQLGRLGRNNKLNNLSVEEIY